MQEALGIPTKKFVLSPRQLPIFASLFGVLSSFIYLIRDIRVHSWSYRHSLLYLGFSSFITISNIWVIWQFKLRLFWICGASPSIKYAMMTVKKGADAWKTSKHVKLTKRIPATSRSLVEYYMTIQIYSGIFGSIRDCIVRWYCHIFNL